MLDLNTLCSPDDMLHHRLSLHPLHTVLNLNAESCFPSQISHMDRDAVGCALPFHGTSHQISFAPKLMDVNSTEHSASSVLTCKTPSDLVLPVDCEASSKLINQFNDRSLFEHDYLNHSDKECKSGVIYADYRLLRDDQRASQEHHSCKLHEVSDSKLSADHGCKLSLEGESSSVIDGKALRPESTGSVDEDAEGRGCTTTRQLFPLKSCSKISVGVQIKPIKPTIEANIGCMGALTSVSSSNELNSNPELPVSSFNLPELVRPGPWSSPANPDMPLPSSISMLNPISAGIIQPMKKSRRGPRSRSSQYRGVTFYRRTGRWESHIWDCGKQVYLGGFDTAHAAARAYDRAAIRFRGLGADINFNLGDYEGEINQMNGITKEEFVHLLRRQSMGFARGISRFKGVVASHNCGRWSQARMGHFLGKMDYDGAPIQSDGKEAITDVDARLHGKLDVLKKPISDENEDDFELSLGMPLACHRASQAEEARNMIAKHTPYSGCSPILRGPNQEGAPANMRQLFAPATDRSSTQQQSIQLTCLDPSSLPSPPLAAEGWQWQIMQQNVHPAASVSTVGCTPSPMQAAAASSGFSPQQQGFTFPPWLLKTGLCYMPTSSIHP